ncbi:MAG: hypothetical protein P8X66_09665 [Maritimibacter sp.]
METLSLQNPVFATYAIAAMLGVLKVMGQGWMTVYRMMKVDAGYASPEDLRPGPLNRAPSPEQLEVNDYVDRSRRMHRNGRVRPRRQHRRRHCHWRPIQQDSKTPRPSLTGAFYFWLGGLKPALRMGQGLPCPAA